MNASENFSGLPGAELVAKGLADLEAGHATEESLLLTFVRPRLLDLGIEYKPLPNLSEMPAHALFSFLEEHRGRDAHSRYNSLLRRIGSFASALERERSAAK